MIVAATVIMVFLSVVILVGSLAFGLSVDKEMNEVVGILAICSLILLGFSLFMFFAGRQSIKEEAVQAGAAEYKVIPTKDGSLKTEFVFKHGPE